MASPPENVVIFLYKKHKIGGRVIWSHVLNCSIEIASTHSISIYTSETHIWKKKKERMMN